MKNENAIPHKKKVHFLNEKPFLCNWNFAVTEENSTRIKKLVTCKNCLVKIHNKKRKLK